ncbi:flavin-containing monooxygenase 5-like [Apostichopus japonicus]|uniref:flavin-containing monooxygenase 5-like n=1 Tax=Stichopus japonicus TaxID=307972 RepID=UPI003AB32113
MRVAIIGAGCSGMAAIKSCVEEGLQPVCFEKTSETGGLWNYREDVASAELGCVFKSTVINTSKEVMSYSDFPCPKEFPNYMHNSRVHEYLSMYVKKFDLLKYIIFETSITAVKRTDDFLSTGRWRVTIKDEKTGSTKEEIFDFVLICTGHHAKPNIPQFPGIDKFKGEVLHTHYYRKPFGHENKRIVVVGIGNSGVDSAVELGRFAKKLFLSTRRGTWLLYRLVGQGIPRDLNRNRVISSFPLWLRNRLIENSCDKVIDHTVFGLKPAHRALSAHPTINDELPIRITSGAVTMKPNIKRFTETGIEFDDGTFEDNIDLVVLATGYDIAFPFLYESFAKIEDNKISLYKHMFYPEMEQPTLAVLGLLQPWGALNPVVELQCRWATRVFNGKVKLPPKDFMWKAIRRKQAALQKRYVQSQRHTIQEDYISYMDEVADEIGVKPNFWKMFFQDPKFWYTNVFGVHLPYQYRLEGPGAWEGAREAIETVWDRVEMPMRTREAVKKPDSVVDMKILFLGLIGLVVIVLMCS